MSRTRKDRGWRMRYRAQAADRQMEHQRRRAQLRRQLAHGDAQQKWERRWERWDQWSYD